MGEAAALPTVGERMALLEEMASRPTTPVFRERWFSIEEAAPLIGVSESHLLALLRADLATGILVGDEQWFMIKAGIALAIEWHAAGRFPDEVGAHVARVVTLLQPVAADGDFVYFIRAEIGGPIKIGYTNRPGNRIRMIQGGNPEKLNFMGCIRGGAQAEAILHNELAAHRIRGEWFRDAPVVVRIVEALVDAYGRPRSEYLAGYRFK